jgi:hypothetical protein
MNLRLTPVWKVGILTIGPRKLSPIRREVLLISIYMLQARVITSREESHMRVLVPPAAPGAPGYLGAGA